MVKRRPATLRRASARGWRGDHDGVEQVITTRTTGDHDAVEWVITMPYNK
jgi:hypothetical protein